MFGLFPERETHPTIFQSTGKILFKIVTLHILNYISVNKVINIFPIIRSIGAFLTGISPASVCKHFLLLHLLQDHWADFLKLCQNVSLNV